MQKTVKIFLFAGQSNMVGSDAHPERIDDFPLFKGAGAPQPDVRYAFLPEGGKVGFQGWEPLRPLQAFGPELTFAHLLKKYDSSPIAIIKSAIGGTTAAYDWNPDAPESGQKLYPRTLQLIRDALSSLDKQGIRYQFEAVVWHQGENDMLDRKVNTAYATNLRAIVQRLRADLQLPKLKWFLGEVSEKGIWGMDNRANLAVLRQQQDQLLASDPLLRWVPTSHLAFDVMGSGQPHYHFGTQGQLQLGEAFGTAYLSEIGKLPKPKERKFAKGLPIPKKGRVRLFVLAGQRNMEGEDAFVSELPAALAQPQSDILFRYALSGGFQSSRNWEPLGPVSVLGNFGPELSLGAQLRKTLPTSEGVALLKFTHSGAQGPDWLPQGSPESRRNLYPKLLAFLRDAAADLTRQGYEPTWEGIFWHPGENDTYFASYLKNYAGWMKSLMAQVRQDLEQPVLPWFVSEQHPKAIWKNMSALNADLRALAETDKQLVIVKTEHFPHQRVHFGTQGTLLLGDALAQAYKDKIR
ncbi:sialate O-acetylesterase [Armatimonas sp.]|uniref:sialate O-acetylesterase n=1 Tax=Armatimonas sp. TaxID=1872638 RepID=UPI00286D368D|nr:sialate O-acetylesterase [Armatimonas sp.]